MSVRTNGNRSTIKLIAMMEATTVTGPAKNLIGFCRRARQVDSAVSGLPRVEASIITFHRGRDAASPPLRQSVERSDVQSANTDQSPNEFVAAAREAGIEVDVINERFRFDPRVIEELRRIIAQRAPDIIQTHNVKSHFLVKLSGLWRHYLWVAFAHGYTATDTKMLAYNRLDRWSLPSADRVVAVCQPLAHDLARVGVPLERISVRHNMVNTNLKASEEEARALRKHLKLNDSERVALAVGRFSREKGHADLIAAFNHLCGINPEMDFRLILVGDGPERQPIERAVEQFGLNDRVTFVGQVSNVHPFYAVADVLALPSHSEGSPNVLLEAMAAGLPTVATAVGGIPEMVADNESALLVASHDPQAMATALNRVLTDTQLACRLASNASALVASHYSPESYQQSLVQIYRELISSAAIQNKRVV